MGLRQWGLGAGDEGERGRTTLDDRQVDVRDLAVRVKDLLEVSGRHVLGQALDHDRERRARRQWRSAWDDQILWENSERQTE